MALNCYHPSVEGAQHGGKSLADFLAYAKKAGATGTTLLALHRVADNDLFDEAIALSGHTTTRAGNSGAALEANEPSHGGLPSDASLWWTWTAPASGRYLAVTAGSDFDTVLAVYSGQALSNLTLVATDDDGAGRQNGVARFDALAGQEYRIAVAGYGVAVTYFSLKAIGKLLTVVDRNLVARLFRI